MMKVALTTKWLVAASVAMLVDSVDAQMVKMCLFYESPSGHARSDPIINQECPSDHIHTVRHDSQEENVRYVHHF